MKKTIFSLIITLLIAVALVGCGKYKEKEEIKVLAPMGTPALSQMYIEKEKEAYNYKIDLVQGADPLSAAFVSKSYDIIYAPLNLGAKLYINNKNYKLLATVVDCNYYLVMKGDSDFTLNDIKDKEIVIFGQAAMSGIISRYVFTNNGFDLTNTNIKYVNSVQDSMSEFIADKNKVVLVSEPQLSNIELKVEGVKALSMKEEYTKVSKESNLPQAAVFVRSDLDKDVAKRYLSHLKDSVNKVNKNVEESAELGSSLYSSFTKEVLVNAIPRSEISLVEAQKAKENCTKFFDLLNGFNPNILGGNVDDAFYFEG